METHKRNPRRVAFGAVGAAIVVLAAACGSSGEESKSADQILTDARNAANAATSVHLVGSVDVNGQGTPVDVKVAKSGATGTSTFAGTKVAVIRSGSNIYIRGAQDILGSFLGPKAKAAVDDKWVQIPTTLPQLSSFAAATDMQQLLKQSLTPKGSVGKAGTRTVDGRKAIVLNGFGTDGKGLLLVAAKGTPYPVEFDGTQGTVTFSDWNTPVSAEPPSGSISLATLMAG